MTYQEILPSPALKNVVRYFWIIDHDPEIAQPAKYKLFAESSANLVFFEPCSECLLAGHTSIPRETMIAGKFKMIGACLYPYSVPLLFELPAHELTHGAIALEVLEGGEASNVKEHVWTAADNFQKIEVLSRYLLKKLNSRTICARSTHGAVQYIVQQSGLSSVDEVVRQMGVSHRQAERRFRESVGFSPKLFSRLIRFHASLKLARHPGMRSLTAIAYHSGYFDQSHFIREFKAFSGMSPRQYFHLGKQHIADNFIRMPE